MNNERRKRIRKVRAQLEELRPVFGDMATEVSDLHDEEDDYLDAIPENMRDGERSQQSEEARDNLMSVAGELENFDTVLDELIDYLEEATR